MVTVLVSSGITQLFLIVSYVAASTYQFFYSCAVNTILVPYVCSAAYYMVIGWKNEHLDGPHAPSVGKARFFGTLGFIYTLFLVWSTGLQGVMITTILLLRPFPFICWASEAAVNRCFRICTTS